jgi:hypothetical protein
MIIGRPNLHPLPRAEEAGKDFPFPQEIVSQCVAERVVIPNECEGSKDFSLRSK